MKSILASSERPSELVNKLTFPGGPPESRKPALMHLLGEKIHAAYEPKVLTVVQLLLAARADPNHGPDHPTVRRFGATAIKTTPIHVAQTAAIAKALLDAKARPDIHALDDAVVDGKMELVKVLLGAGVDTTGETDRKGQVFDVNDEDRFEDGRQTRPCEALVRQSAASSLRVLLRGVLHESAAEIALDYLLFDDTKQRQMQSLILRMVQVGCSCYSAFITKFTCYRVWITNRTH